MLALGFYAGIRTADRYHEEAKREKEYALNVQYVRLKTGSDADDPCKPYVPRRERFEVSPEFEKSFRENGRATEMLNKQKGDLKE